MMTFLETDPCGPSQSKTIAFTCRASCKDRDVSKHRNAGRVKSNARLCPILWPVVGTAGELPRTQVQLEGEPVIFQWAPCLPEQPQPVAPKIPHAIPRDSAATP